MYLIHLFVVLSWTLKLTNTANILAVLSVLGHSHLTVQMEVLKGLLINGHKVTVLSTNKIDYKHENFTFFHMNEKVKIDESAMVKLKTNPVESFLIGINYGYYSRKNHIKDDNFQNLLKNNSFDLIYLECVLCVHAILAEVHKCPIILTTSTELNLIQHRMIGQLIHHSSDMLSYPVINGKLSFADRVVLFYPFTELLYQILKFVNEILFNHLIESAFPNNNLKPPLDTFESRLKMIFSFTTLWTSNPIPEVPIHYHIGSIHIKPPKQLEPTLEITKFLDKSSNGVIVMSFGSFANLLPEELFQRFLNTFKDLPYDVVWKTNLDSYQHLEIPKNILVQEWLPLADVLAHKNVKLLISHGGLRTIEEAIDREIPMILFPLFYDQPFNGLLMSSHNIGINMDLINFTQKSLTATIYELMKDIYKGNVRKIREFIADRMSTSLETAVDNIEYFIKHNETFEYLSYPGRDVSFFVKYFCDIHLILIGIIISLKIIFKFLFNLIRNLYFVEI